MASQSILPVGRPKKWTDEKIQEEADFLLKWAKLPDSLVLASCYGDRGYAYEDAWEWEQYHEYFRKAKRIAKTIVGARREKGAVENDYDSAMVRSTMANYDFEHKAMLKEMKREEIIADIAAQEASKKLSEQLKSLPAVKK